MSNSGAALDGVSREVLRGFAIRLSALSLFAAIPMLAGRMPLAAGAGYLAMSCSIGCLITLARAMARRHVFAAGPLNCWDEAMAFAALSRLLHLLA